MPDPHNAAIHLGRAVARLADMPTEHRPPAVVLDFLSALGLDEVVAHLPHDPAAAHAALERLVDDRTLRRSLAAMLRDTVTPTVIHAGSKVNVVPGSGRAELDVRTLPGTDQEALLRQVAEVAGSDVRVEPVISLPAIEADPEAPIVGLMRDALERADPDARAIPMMITPGTDAKALATIGIPTYGFVPLRLDAGAPFLDLFHANDERIPVSALAFGLPVLTEVVTRFALAEAG
jgi:acetylornithine deacetylase/succinyl-diaminopimelate desuccinylase-like protein